MTRSTISNVASGAIASRQFRRIAPARQTPPWGATAPGPFRGARAGGGAPRGGQRSLGGAPPRGGGPPGKEAPGTARPPPPPPAGRQQCGGTRHDVRKVEQDASDVR